MIGHDKMLSLTDRKIALVHCLLHDSKSTLLQRLAHLLHNVPKVVWMQELKAQQSCACLSLETWVYAGHGGLAGHSGYVGMHYEGRECLWPGRTGLWEHAPRIFVLHGVRADQAEALRVWSPVGVLAVRGVLGMWEAWRCQWAAAENTQSFRKHWQVYRGLVPADSAFSDLKWRESFLSLKSLLHPTVQRSKTIRHHKQTDTKEQNPDYI